MNRANRDDMIVIGMAISALLESVRQTETWWRMHGDKESLRRTRELAHVIKSTRSKFFVGPPGAGNQINEALFVAEGLRDAARQCQEGQASLHERLIGGAETIERLCHLRGEGR